MIYRLDCFFEDGLAAPVQSLRDRFDLAALPYHKVLIVCGSMGFRFTEFETPSVVHLRQNYRNQMALAVPSNDLVLGSDTAEEFCPNWAARARFSRMGSFAVIRPIYLDRSVFIDHGHERLSIVIDCPMQEAVQLKLLYS